MFESRRWGEIARLKYGKAHSNYRASGSGTVPVFGTNGPIGFTGSAMVDRPGVIIGRKGAYRGVHYSDVPFSVIDTAFYLELDAGNLDKWAYYALQLADINGLDSGSAIPSTTREGFYSLQVLVPDTETQRAIAEVLGALDDKINTNAARDELILDHVGAVYEREARAGSLRVSLDRVADFHNRRRVPLSSRERDERVGPVPYYGATGVVGFVDEALFDDRYVLIGEDGSVMREDGSAFMQYIWGPAWVNNHAHVLSGRGMSTEALGVAIARENVTSLVTGAVQPKLNMGNLKTLELDVPSRLPELESLISNQMALYRSGVENSRTLTQLRDTLLPQLMSGKLRVRDAEKTVEGVL